jgi:hypothetical protein
MLKRDEKYEAAVVEEATQRGESGERIQKWKQFRGWLRGSAKTVAAGPNPHLRNYIAEVLLMQCVIDSFVNEPQRKDGDVRRAVLAVVTEDERSLDGYEVRQNGPTNGEKVLLGLRSTFKPWQMDAHAPWLADYGYSHSDFLD